MQVPTSEQRAFWEWSSVGSWFSTFVFRDVPETVPDCTRTCGIRRLSSKLDKAPKILLKQLLPYPVLRLLRHLNDIFPVYSRDSWVQWLAVPRASFLIFFSNCCQLFLFPKVAILERKLRNSVENRISIPNTHSDFGKTKFSKLDNQ